MLFLLISALFVSVFTSSYGFLLFAGDDKDICPPIDQIDPCTCYKAPVSHRIIAHCSNFTDATALKNIFVKNPDWSINDVYIEQSVMSYLPAEMLEKARFQSLNVSSTTLYTLFDVTPAKTPELNLYLHNVKLLRGFEWASLANSTLLELMTYNLPIKRFGKEFIDNIPKTVRGLWFDNSKTVEIAPKAFAALPHLKYLAVTGGSLTKLSRDMFPKPTELYYLQFSSQKISSLPDGLLSDMDALVMFRIENNQLMTVSQKVFIGKERIFGLEGNPINCNCEIKWITSTDGLDLSRISGDCSQPDSMKTKKLAALKPSDFSYCK
ncbi:uncharacterized protein NPIL_556341 [Nephila pilipes]|uniref:Uncharacterized protein n=1 Tax=Nephila pilipes TaxID=299642 RepID=A0A8X6NMP9_NEPPI|nr:uncharacterized protein NPIL_556341 [Nephila pilipes]